VTAYEYIRDCVNTKLESSIIQGVGVFALRDIKKDEELFKLWEGESDEYTLTDNELNSLDESVREHLLNMYGYKQIDSKFTMFVTLNKNCHWIFKTPFHWVNSCGYNGEPNINKETLRTTRFIKKGEELLLNYGKYGKFKKTNII